MKIVLGIESTAHTFGIGIASSEGKIFANVNDTYKPIAGGIHPREASEHHSKVAYKLLRNALEESNFSFSDIDGIAVALGPGLGPCLRVGATLARFLSVSYNKPLIPVNHAVAHIEISILDTGFKDPVIVYVAGGNTLITSFRDSKYRIFGETLDMALGNCIDTFAREIGFSYPGVPKIEQLAKRGKKYLEMPYSVKGQDLSYSGLLTYVLNKVKENKYKLEDLCYSFIETAYSMLTEVSERALAFLNKKEITITGGLARSELLCKKLKLMAEDHGALFRPVSPSFAGDNGAMIAYTGALALEHNLVISLKESYIRPLWRIDEVDILWRKN